MNTELTELVFILDRSGSMGGLESDTIGGFNGMIAKQKAQGKKVNVTGLKCQEDFYRNYLKAYEGKNRVIVIISDAFRYECAKELMERLELDEKCTPKLECMISSLPSVTSVGIEF